MHPMQQAEFIARQLEGDPVAAGLVKEYLTPVRLSSLLGLREGDVQAEIMRWIHHPKRTRAESEWLIQKIFNP